MAYLHLSLVGNESHGMWESFTDVNSRFNASITYLESGIFGTGARPQQILSLLPLMSRQLPEGAEHCRPQWTCPPHLG